MTTIPCIVVGCGPRAEGHGRAIRRSPHFTVDGCLDIVPAAAHQYGDRHRACVYATLEDATQEATEHVYVVSTPPTVRAELVTELCRRGSRGILLEKPIAVEWSSVEQMVRCARRSNDIPLLLNHQLGFSRALQALRREAEASGVGPIRRVHVSSRASWVEHGPHLLNLAAVVLGGMEWQRVRAWRYATGEAQQGLLAAASIVATVDLAGDRRMVVECGGDARRWPGRENEWHQMGIEAYGERGHVAFSLNSGWDIWSPAGHSSMRYDHDAEDDASQMDLLADVHAILQQGSPSGYRPGGSVTIEDEWEATTLLFAVSDAARTSQPVTRDAYPLTVEALVDVP